MPGSSTSGRTPRLIRSHLFPANVVMCGSPKLRHVIMVTVGAALGAALRAFQAFEVACGRGTSWDEVIRDFVTPLAESRIAPHAERVELYRELRRVYTACEEHALGRGEDPTSFLARYQDA